MAEREFMVRGRGYIKEVRDLENVALGVGAGRRADPAQGRRRRHHRARDPPRPGRLERRGRDRRRHRRRALRRRHACRPSPRVKERLAELEAGLPEGVEISVAYDRSGLIERSIETLTHTLIEESIVVALVCLVFLFHFRSAFVAIVSIPVSILLAFIIMRLQGLSANIMSLGGIAISIGVLVDAAVIMVENAHKHYEEWRGKRSHFEIILRSAQEVGPTLFFTLLVITVSFLPVFTLRGAGGAAVPPAGLHQDLRHGRCRRILAVTVVPVLMFWFVRGRILSEKRHPVSRLLRFLYTPVLNVALRCRWAVIVVMALVLLRRPCVPLQRLGSEFMPPLWEGDLLYMPTTFPGISITKARELLQQTDKIIRTFPEVESVFGKVGRAETATDPAPLSMIETTISAQGPAASGGPGMTTRRS